MAVDVFKKPQILSVEPTVGQCHFHLVHSFVEAQDAGLGFRAQIRKVTEKRLEGSPGLVGLGDPVILESLVGQHRPPPGLPLFRLLPVLGRVIFKVVFVSSEVHSGWLSGRLSPRVWLVFSKICPWLGLWLDVVVVLESWLIVARVISSIPRVLVLVLFVVAVRPRT